MIDEKQPAYGEVLQVVDLGWSDFAASVGILSLFDEKQPAYGEVLQVVDLGWSDFAASVGVLSLSG